VRPTAETFPTDQEYRLFVSTLVASDWLKGNLQNRRRIIEEIKKLVIHKVLFKKRMPLIITLKFRSAPNPTLILVAPKPI
jgi:hypothetical protein